MFVVRSKKGFAELLEKVERKRIFCSKQEKIREKKKIEILF